MRTEIYPLYLMNPIELGDMDAIRLMNRTDIKYLTDMTVLPAVLKRLGDMGYFVFELFGDRIHEYRSMYYDTAGLQMYLDHHNRRLVRQKLRTRCYVSSGRTFVELKSKNNHGRTKKKRLEISKENYNVTSFEDPGVLSWLEDRMCFPPEGVFPSLETTFSRITLVNPDMTERSTIDFDLRFQNERTGQSADMGRLVVIEVKQDGNVPSPMREILLDHRVKPFRISKYCIGIAMTDPSVRSGRFKQKIMRINKLKAQI